MEPRVDWVVNELEWLKGGHLARMHGPDGGGLKRVERGGRFIWTLFSLS